MPGDPLLLEGRVALVTGAGSGIGAATAALFADHGATVYCADLDRKAADATVAALRTAGRPAAGLRLDVREEESWERAMQILLAAEGRLDVLAHCAGISAASPLAETSLAEWRRVLAANLDGAFLATREAVRAMGARGGSVVHVGSASGIRAAPGAAAYSTSKAALAALARAAAKECRAAGLPVRINVVSPAGVRTPLWRSMPFFQAIVADLGSEEAAFAAMEAAPGGGRFAEPGEVAQAILFLASDRAAQVTGVELPVDAGYTL